MASLERTVSQDSKCPVCSNLLIDPKQLSCTHTFCQKCFREMLACSSQSNANTLACPICKKTTSVTDGKVVLEKKAYCQEDVHKSDDNKYICTDVCASCNKVICSKCLIYHEKKGHTVKNAGEYNTSFRKDTESLLALGKAKITTVNKHITCVDNQLKRVIDHIDGEKAKINKTCEEAIKKIKERNVTLNKILDAQKEKLCQSLKDMKVADESLVTSIESASELASNSLKAPLEGDVVAIRDSLSGELKNVLDRDDPKPMLVSDVADRAEELTLIPSGHPDQLSMGELRFMKCESKCNVALSKKDSLSTMAATKNGMMAVGSGSNGGIAIFSEDGKLQQTWLKDTYIRALGFLTNGRYVVLDTDNNMLLYKSGYGLLDVTFITLDHSEGGSCKLTVDKDNLIYVGYRKVKMIHVFSPTGGNAIRKIPCDGYEPMQITKCGDSLIVKQRKNAIISIDRKGDIVHKVVTSSGQSLYASVTKSNSVLIASVRHEVGLLNIDVYTSDLKHVKTLISDHKIQKPEKRNWYYLQQFQSGVLAFCTPDRLYIFNLSATQVKP